MSMDMFDKAILSLLLLQLLKSLTFSDEISPLIKLCKTQFKDKTIQNHIGARVKTWYCNVQQMVCGHPSPWEAHGIPIKMN